MQAAIPLMMAAGPLIQGIGGYKAAIYTANADEVNATDAERQGAAEAARIRDQARIAMGNQVGAQAESGFAVGTGTALASLRDSAVNAELDVLNARRQAAGQAAAYRAQAHLARQQGTFSLLSGLTGAASAVAGYKSDYAQAKAGAGY